MFQIFRAIIQPSSDGFPEGQTDQPFDGWNNPQRNFISPFQRAFQAALANDEAAKAKTRRTLKRPHKIKNTNPPGVKNAGLSALR